MSKDYPKIFPKNFFWGASTAAHQVEGNNYNDWSVWELAHAKELAQTAHRRLSYLDNWDKIKKQAEDPNNYVSGRGVEHYKRYKEDFDIVKQLNMNAFRFSIEWSRLEPKEGVWDLAELDHYKKYIAELRKRNIEPFLNIWHWTMPTWFTQKGAFSKKRNLVYFDRFVKKIAEELVDDVSYVITLNEPNVYAAEAYITAQRPPQKKNIGEFLIVYRNLWLAHRRAYKILKIKKPSLQVGIASQLANIQAKRPHNFFDEASTKIMRYLWNWLFLKRTSRYQDFIGINYYFTNYFTGLLKEIDPKFPRSDQGIYMEPEGIYPIMLRTWSRFKKPIFITENGLADSTDHYRRWWIEESIVAMERAISDGVDLRGYLHWSLLDNFEWEFGYWPHYGLVSVDRTNNMKRTIKPSAKWFAERIKEL
jgi:beta-glucosidase